MSNGLSKPNNAVEFSEIFIAFCQMLRVKRCAAIDLPTKVFNGDNGLYKLSYKHQNARLIYTYEHCRVQKRSVVCLDELYAKICLRVVATLGSPEKIVCFNIGIVVNRIEVVRV